MLLTNPSVKMLLDAKSSTTTLRAQYADVNSASHGSCNGKAEMRVDKKNQFIELGRTFNELSKHAGKSDDVDLSQILHVKSNLKWVDVLDMPRAVILSEAGSGKTQEIRHAVLRLRAQGKAAFFIRLEFIPDDFEIAFETETGTLEEFQAWLASGYPGWLFLDSVDEARLRSPNDFARAIRRLGKLIDRAKSRTNIILTGRTHAWRPKTDFDLCEQHIGFPPEMRTALQTDNSLDLGSDEEFEEEIDTREVEETAPYNFRIIALDDLSRGQVEIFAAAKHVSDVGDFIKEIERVDAWPATARPQDLEDVIALWKNTGEVGNRLQIMENSINRRLTERDQLRAEAYPLSDLRAREGAMLLAAAATLGQTQVIRVPDGAENTTGLSPKSVLADWDDAEIAALLSRPIFDDAIYGTVRFHHRSAREYLTACWLAKLLERRTSRRAIEDLLFKNTYGMEVVVPTMRPILPWLAIFDARVRDRLRAVAPEVIFEGGDPSSLPLPTRREILYEVCGKIAQERVVYSATEYAAVQRFAQPDIAQDIARLMKQFGSNDAVLGFLTRMIWLGRLRALRLEAKKIALLQSASRYTRISAFRALREVGTVEDLLEVREAFLSEGPLLGREWIGELITDLEPSGPNMRWVFETLSKSENKERYSVDRLEEALTSFVDSIPIDALNGFLGGVSALLAELPVIERGYCEVSKQYAWMMKPAAHAAERLIAARKDDALGADCLEVLRKFRVAREWGHDLRDIKVGFGQSVPEWQSLNDASFWHDITETRRVVSRKGERLTDYWQASVFGAFWKFTKDDFDRACDWIRSRADLDDRLVAVTLAFAIYHENGKPKAWKEHLTSICSSKAELAQKLKERLSPSPEMARYRKQEREWKRRADARVKRNAEQFEKNKAAIQGNIEAIRDPKFPNPAVLSRTQWYLHHQIREQKGGGSSKWTDGRWRELIPLFGQEVAEAYRDGAVNFWRKYNPVLRSEGAEANQTAAGVIFGLTGLEIESRERPDSFHALSHDDVTRATKYALSELNGFPSWFPDFYQRHRVVAAKVVLDEVRYELLNSSPEHDTHYVLSDISWSAEWAWNDFAPALLEMLEKAEPQNAHHLHQMLKVIQGSDISDQAIARLARAKVAEADPPNASDWFAVWVGVEPDEAIPALANHLSALPDAGAKTMFAMRFISKLWGGRRSETFGARGSFRTPSHLKILYLLMHQHIRVQEDIERANGCVFSPELRDDAQDGRNRILQELSKAEGKEAFLALEEIATAHRQHPTFPYLENLCRDRAQRDSDLRAWQPDEVRDFNERLDRSPSNHRELADLANLRLLDFRDDLEEGDESIAAVVRTIDQETVLRNFIGHDLRQKAFTRYHIPQEAQLADDKKPDLRFHGMGFDAPVPVELKIADKWTGPKLFERLENQLAGDYLRDVRGGRGIFLLVYRGVEKGGWELPVTRRHVKFDELLQELRAHWARLAARFPNIDDVTIIGIDLTKRTS